ncbi:MAG: type III pantothenate kinase [Candidatus Cloacimonetes bacterium]|jgi:type III pantothenate kinase|nr:type III pantothenate kinase [Candidatus Cloacimonadota bacterium]MDD3282406.1 type III pantothenate kinase [Candidatus Cloacimonadota bacterium]MDD4231428.1 type III pantothenate kinase [Candidatus Cloacimonadota bacterium]MDY0299465.1 type III pantothenate kinase [Candidatus Cloacimonadaceae bacterium]
MPITDTQDPILIVDIGNTNIVCAVFFKGEIQARYRFPSTVHSKVDEYYSLFGQMVPEYSLSCFKYIAYGSVVPELSRTFQTLFSQYSRAKVYCIDGLSPIGLRYIIKDPSAIGADLVANAFGAWQKYNTSTLVADLGTATTIQLINSEGLYAGAVIAPGMKTAAEHLFKNAAQLNEFELSTPKQIVGNNTQDALLAGIVWGHALMISGFMQQIEKKYPQYAPYTVILTGGLAPMIGKLCPSDYILDSDLTLQGFYLALHKLISISE